MLTYRRRTYSVRLSSCVRTLQASALHPSPPWPRRGAAKRTCRASSRRWASGCKAETAAAWTAAQPPAEAAPATQPSLKSCAPFCLACWTAFWTLCEVRACRANAPRSRSPHAGSPQVLLQGGEAHSGSGVCDYPEAPGGVGPRGRPVPALRPRPRPLPAAPQPQARAAPRTHTRTRTRHAHGGLLALL